MYKRQGYPKPQKTTITEFGYSATKLFMMVMTALMMRMKRISFFPRKLLPLQISIAADAAVPHLSLIHILKHADLPSVPSNLIQSPLSQIAACVVFILFTWLFIYFRSMRRHNKYNLYSAITYLAPAGILFIVIHQFYLRTINQTAPFYLSESGILMCTSFALFYLCLLYTSKSSYFRQPDIKYFL